MSAKILFYFFVYNSVLLYFMSVSFLWMFKESVNTLISAFLVTVSTHLWRMLPEMGGKQVWHRYQNNLKSSSTLVRYQFGRISSKSQQYTVYRWLIATALSLFLIAPATNLPAVNQTNLWQGAFKIPYSDNTKLLTVFFSINLISDLLSLLGQAVFYFH